MTNKRLNSIFDSQQWTFAKSMPDTPHWYIKRSDFTNEDLWEEIVIFIRKNGVPKKFFRATYMYLFLGEYKYWTMGNPPEVTTIINRAKI